MAEGVASTSGRKASKSAIYLIRAIACCLMAIGSLPIGDCRAQTTPAVPVSNPTAVPGVDRGNSSSSAATATVQSTNAHAEHLALLHLIDSIEPYHPTKELKGTAVLAGSTTMQMLGKAWSERFRKFHPDVTFERGKDGTDAGLQEISQRPNVIAGSSRPLTDSELESLKGTACKEPFPVIVALDPLALYVHKDNPIQSISPSQLEAIFRAPGGSKPHVAKWGELGVTGEWADKPIRIHTRGDHSGTTGFIKNWVIQGGDLARSTQVHETNDKVCNAIAADKFGVGLSGFGESRDTLKAVALSLPGGVVSADEQRFLSGRYPFVRPLVLVIDKTAMANDGGLRESLLRYVLSRDGQLEAVRAGFYPLDPAFIRKELDQIAGPQVR
ncbi:MAG: PstS family phosphate ABC transporter substrate-binding protein [Pirellula sp.]